MRKRVFPGSSSRKVMNTPGPIDKDGTVSGKSGTRVAGFDIFSGIVEEYSPFCDLKGLLRNKRKIIAAGNADVHHFGFGKCHCLVGRHQVVTTGATRKFSDAELPVVLQISPSIRTLPVASRLSAAG